MKNIWITPARKGSKKIHNKNIRFIDAMPLIYYTIKAAIKSNFFDKIIVGTDSKNITNYINDENLENFEKIETKGVKVFIEPSATMFFIGSEMDYTSDKLSSRFIFNNPNEKSSCGWVESFNI